MKFKNNIIFILDKNIRGFTKFYFYKLKNFKINFLTLQIFYN